MNLRWLHPQDELDFRMINLVTHYRRSIVIYIISIHIPHLIIWNASRSFNSRTGAFKSRVKRGVFRGVFLRAWSFLRGSICQPELSRVLLYLYSPLCSFCCATLCIRVVCYAHETNQSGANARRRFTNFSVARREYSFSSVWIKIGRARKIARNVLYVGERHAASTCVP